jgi:energy-coupling factor transporter ATP-binding protein EcfA2
MSTLNQFKDYVAEQYYNMLGLKLVEETTTNTPLAWLNDGNSAWLLDDEIGLAMRIVPFVDEQDDLNAAIQHAIRFATQLQPRYSLDKDGSDDAGIWQVGICWLVSSELCNAWRNAIANIRKESGFSEEIGLDAILAEEGKDIHDAFSKHGMPQLMLHARKIFRLQWHEMPSWLSADSKVAEMLESFPRQFSNDVETYKLALELVENVLPDGAPDSAPFPEEPSKETLDEVEIKNFRNIRHLKLRFKDVRQINPAQAHIIFGPNGTGKTSLFEALYLATGNTSNTLKDYLCDPDADSKKRGYAPTVLAQLSGNTQLEPTTLLNGIEKSGYKTASKEEAKENYFSMEGTFQAQEDTRKFLEEPGESLALRILKNYSTLADEVTKHAEARSYAAKSEKSEWLKNHGLNASISIRETRAKRLIEGEIRKEPWSPSQTLMEWLEKTSQFFPTITSDSQRLFHRWQSWHESQEAYINSMAQGISIGEITVVHQPLATWLSSRNKLLEDTRTLVNSASPLIDSLRSRLRGVEAELDAWGEWIAKQTSLSSASTNEEEQQLIQQMEQIRQRLAELRQSFSFDRKHSQHLEKLKTEFLTDWVKTNPDICPTCGDDHHDKGGIGKVIDTLKAGLDERLANFEQEGKTLNGALAEMEAKLASFGVCPIGEKRQAELHELLAPFCRDATLQTILTNKLSRATLKSSIQAAQRLPEVQTPITEPTDIAQQLAERCMALDAEAERLWVLPERWAKIVKALDNECRDIVERHLPETLQKLWWEIALVMTPARWNLAAAAEFQMKGRTSQKLIIGIKERSDTPAKYFFNQAERHIMGLAWFFARYLTHGRFHRAFMVLDDPAQEMDQTTFRTFSRFVQALLRLHIKQKTQAQIVIFLHQEERALDMARATLGRFIMLTWQKQNNDDGLREMRLLIDNFQPHSALHLLSHRANIST